MFGFKRRDRVIDLSEHYRKQKEQIDAMKEEAKETSLVAEHTTKTSGGSGGVLGFFGSMSNSSVKETPSTESVDLSSVNPDERKRKLAKRLADMTEKIEDLSNQIYHLQQRFEVVEKKLNINRFE